MCVVSMVGDHYNEKWKDVWPYHQPQPNPFVPDRVTTAPAAIPFWSPQGPTQQQFDDLKKEVEEMKKLLKRAVEYDKNNNEPHCEMEDKVALLKKVAALVGVSLEDIFLESK